MDKMIEGYRRFLATSWPARQALFQDLAEHGQNPHAMVIACADSRVDPAMIFDAAPGEIFTVPMSPTWCPPTHRMAASTPRPPHSNSVCGS
jgi:carbonic anhydrase